MDQVQPHDSAMPEAEEAGFIRAAQRGDRVAYLALARWHWPAVSGIARVLAPPDRVEERILDVFEHGWKGLHFIPEGQRYFAWILRIAFNLCRSAPELEAFRTTAAVEPAADPDDVPAQIDGAFLKLAVQHRDPLILALACSLSHADIGRVLDIAPRTVAQRLSEARAELYNGRGGWLPTTGLRHFKLAQLCDYVGTDPAAAPAFVRDHLADCADCRAVLTALESQDRILARRLAGRADGEGVEGFLHDMVERLGDASPPERAEASEDEAKADAPRPPVAVPRVSRPPGRESRKPAPVRAARPDHPGPTLAALVMVVMVLLAVVLGPRAQPWLTRIGFHWGPPSNRDPATEVAGARSPSHSWASSETTSHEGSRMADSADQERRVPHGIPPAPQAPDSAGRTPASRMAATPATSTVTSPATRAPSTPTRRVRTRPDSTARAAAPVGLLCGQVVDPEGQPIEGAQVVVAGVEVVLATDRTGRFCLTAPGGEQVLFVARSGFTALSRRVNVGPRSAELTLVLDPVSTP